MKPDEESIVVEQTYHVPASRVWAAITEVDQMRKWYFSAISEFETRVGFATEFVVANEGREFVHVWSVTEVVPDEKIVYRWQFGGYPGDSFVTFAIRDIDADHSALLLTHSVTEEFPDDDIPEFSRESCLGGWTFFIQQNLKGYLEEGIENGV